MTEIEMRKLYSHAWELLRQLREQCSEIDRESTPVLAFGQWKTAKVVTAGLNPSEAEFRNSRRDENPNAPLAHDRQRFLHWGDGNLTHDKLELAIHRIEGYFTLGNSYRGWFGKYDPFLKSLGASFESGIACHTDYVSPFATHVGISKCSGNTQRLLRFSGEQYWISVLESCPQIKLLFGHGRGWRRMPELLSVDLKSLPTPFDHKGGRTTMTHLQFGVGVLPSSRRRILAYWWVPNRDGSPLCYLNADEKGQLGELVRTHAALQEGAL